MNVDKNDWRCLSWYTFVQWKKREEEELFQWNRCCRLYLIQICIWMRYTNVVGLFHVSWRLCVAMTLNFFSEVFFYSERLFFLLHTISILGYSVRTENGTRSGNQRSIYPGTYLSVKKQNSSENKMIHTVSNSLWLGGFKNNFYKS